MQTTTKQDRQRNIETPLCNHCHSGKAISIAYSWCVFVALGIQRWMLMCNTVICGMPDSKIFFHTLSYKARFYI